MALSEDTIAGIGQLMGERADRADFALAFEALRAAMPGLVLLRCEAADVLEAPFRSYAALDLHLVDTRDHCTVMTDDPARATGVLLALKAAS